VRSNVSVVGFLVFSRAGAQKSHDANDLTPPPPAAFSHTKSMNNAVMKSIRWTLVPALLCLAGTALAQNVPPGPGLQMEQHMQKARAKLLREKVGLTDDKARKVEAVLDKVAPERKRIVARMRDARQKLRALVTLNSEDQNAYRTNLDQLRSSRKALMDLMDKAFAEISKDLTPKEQARLFLALDKLRGVMREAAMHRVRMVDDESEY